MAFSTYLWGNGVPGASGGVVSSSIGGCCDFKPDVKGEGHVCFLDWPVLEAVTESNSENAVEPGISLRRRLEHRIDPEVVTCWIADLGSWRTIYLLSGGASLVLLLSLRCAIPPREPSAGRTYRALMASMERIFVRTEVLRRRAFYHAAMFGAFSVFWTAVPLRLSGPPLYLTEKGIAWVALAGVAGAIAPPFAGRLADKGWAKAGTASAMLLAAFSFVLSNLGGRVFGLATVGTSAVLIDFAVSANLVFGQRAIYALGPEERSRINGLFMATFFAGGAVASALSGWCFARFGWLGVSVIGVALLVLALLYWTTEGSKL